MHSQRLSKMPHHFVLLLMVNLLIGCASGGKIRSDYDRDANFGSYRTYNFIADSGAGAGGYQGFFAKYMVEAITIEMEQRGYTQSDNPDLLVNFNSILQEKTKVTTSPAPMAGGYYGYRGSRYGAWGGYGYATETNVSQYTEGTFNIDLVDNARKQLVWEAVVIRRISQKDLDNLEEGVRNGVPRCFALYPFRAGDSIPVPAN